MTTVKEDPITTSPITITESTYHLLDPTHSTNTSNPSSFQSDHLLTLHDPSSDPSAFGFTRPEFKKEDLLVGSVPFYQRHVFLCYKNPLTWPPRIEAAEFDRLPRLLSAALASRKPDFNHQTRLTICEGRDGTETSNGDVLIFPDMIRYRRLTHFDVDTFVEEVLIKDVEWVPGNPEKLKGSYIFVCCHGSRDRRCGVCGPPLVTRFKEEIELLGLQEKVSVSPCSHVGGHKYAGNVIIFGPSISGEVTGHWYGYVHPDDVPILLERHIMKGEIVEGLWRGQMGIFEEDQKKAQELRPSNNSRSTDLPEKNNPGCGSHPKANGCCQTIGSKCQPWSSSSETFNFNFNDDDNNNDNDNDNEATVTCEKKKKRLFRGNSWNGAGKRKVCTLPRWFEDWEREDTYAALAVVSAVFSVAIAYRCLKQV